ncbi:MAG: CpsD/CapB family tyrosine-protein kinase [Anaerolineaceae bacterium]|nr:CpsD/CapB family tyrosine-protein kinase [Anaerolineaceae bacterium]
MANICELIVNEKARSPIAEAFRTLRTNLQFSKAAGELKVIVFTSSGPGEGKSTVVANTAVALAQAGKKVLILDCDLRRPIQHKIFRLKNYGLTNALVEESSVDSIIQQSNINNVYVVTSGPIPPNPSELLGTGRMQALLNALMLQCDVILVDAPPIIAVTDASILAAKADGVILVVNSGTNRPEIIQKAKELLTKAHSHILGIVLNRVDIEDEAYYYYYYGTESKKSG